MRNRARTAPGLLAFLLGSLYLPDLKVFALVDEAVSDPVAKFGMTGYIFPANAVNEQVHDAMVSRLPEAAHRIGVKIGDPFWAP